MFKAMKFNISPLSDAYWRTKGTIGYRPNISLRGRDPLSVPLTRLESCRIRFGFTDVDCGIMSIPTSALLELFRALIQCIPNT